MMMLTVVRRVGHMGMINHCCHAAINTFEASCKLAPVDVVWLVVVGMQVTWEAGVSIYSMM